MWTLSCHLTIRIAVSGMCVSILNMSRLKIEFLSLSSADGNSEVEGDAGDRFVNQYTSGSSLSEDGSISEGENEQTVPSGFEVSSVSSASEAAGDEAQTDSGDGV